MTTNTQDSSDDTQQLPPNWQPDPSLREAIPDEYDWRLFRRLTAAPKKYAVNISGRHPYVWNLTKNCPVEPMHEGSKGCRLVQDPNPMILAPKRAQRPKPTKQRIRMKLYLGRLVGERTFTLARLVAEAVYGAPPHPKSQAHHKQTYEDRYDDVWSNVYWRSPGENLAIERVRPKPPKQHAGALNTNAKLHRDTVQRIVFLADQRGIKAPKLAKQFRISPAHVRRILREEVWGDEVRAFRAPFNTPTSIGRGVGS
jgi:hypothetical protein